jgi:hypothetical protein
MADTRPLQPLPVSADGMAEMRWLPQLQELHRGMSSPEVQALTDLVLGLIQEAVPYFDRVVVWLDRFNSPPDLNELAPLCGGPVMGWRGPMRKYKRAGKWVYDEYWGYQLILNQPTREAFAYLHDHYIGIYFINYVEIALDFTTTTQARAERIGDFFMSTFVKPWFGSHQVKRCKNGVYFGQRKRGPGTIFVIYNDHLSKVTGTPTCHTEVRFKGRDAVCRAFGKDPRTNAVCFEDLRDFAPRPFWRRRLQLKHITSAEDLGKARLGRRRKKPLWQSYGRGFGTFNAYRCTGEIILRGSELDAFTDEQDGVIVVQEMINTCRWFEGHQCVQKIDNERFLPA